MALLKASCPRCGTSGTTFDVTAQKSLGILESGWVEHFEMFSVCRHCHKPTIFAIKNKEYENAGSIKDPNGAVKYTGYLNDFMLVTGYVNIKNNGVEGPPDYVPDDIAAVYLEASTCLVVQCWNAAGAMFRLAVDLATKKLLPEVGEPAAKIRRSLGLRLQWLFEQGLLPSELQELAECIKEDGNDGAHDATLTKNEALDLQDFTRSLLERIYTVPKRLELAAERRRERRGG